MFYIFDCNDQIVGNQKGYRTMRGAQSQYENHRTKVHKAIWAAVDARKAAEDAANIAREKRGGRICSIRLKEES
jgi:multidrug efflux pump subunit AcrA (membrane-fusion protein)